ncbi:hypothetical protein Y032_0816g2505 [Ancylostoma ceylanicum]|nr:hypothetical protein Y032_0816g2505 [Ancylostoma ceylanicum]
MHKRGSSVSEISKTLKLHREQAYRVRSRFGETGGIESRSRGRPDQTARTPAFRNAVKSKLRRNPDRSTKQLAKNHKRSRSTTRRLIIDDLELYPTNSLKDNVSQAK